MDMIKPERLRPGDKVAIVSLSAGTIGEPWAIHKYHLAKERLEKVIALEAGRPDLPILYNANIGHAKPIAVIPYGVRCELDLDNKTFTLLESATL